MNNDDALILRAAHRSEASEIASISRLQVEHGLNWRWTPKRIKTLIEDKQTTVVVASINGVIEGFGSMQFTNTESHLILLAVQPKSRRCGIGKAVVKWLEEACSDGAVERISLEVRLSNQVARRFYEALGYRFVRTIRKYYAKDEAAIVMEKLIKHSN